MSGSRLNSGHLPSLRRTLYRQAREELLDARGWQSGCLEGLRGMVNAVEWSLFLPFRPDELLPATRFLLADQQANQVHGLETGLNTIGRFSDNDIVFTENWISRRHCVILVHTTGVCELHDTASRNGTFVNGNRVVRPVQLSSGDIVQVCDKVLYFFAEEEFRRLVELQEIGGQDEPSESTTTTF